ncbi:MAG: PKD domain-containing protein, partial [Pseudomonadales bacterium]
AITGSSATFTVSQFNSAPVANAGPDQTVNAEVYVTLDGSNSSDIDATPLTYAWTQSSGTAVTLSGTTVAQPTFTAPKLEVDDPDVLLVFSLTVNDGQANSTADTVTVTVQPLPQTPQNKFMEDEVEISEVLIDGAERSLYSSFTVNRRALESVRKQFFSAQDKPTEVAAFVETRGDVPFDIKGSIILSRTALNASGSFFVQNSGFDGSYRQLFSGDFDVQRDGITGSSTATLSARAAWEYKVSDDTVLGYFISGEAADSKIGGEYVGDQTRSAASSGGYAMHQLDQELYLDGFLSFGMGLNDLKMANNILAVESKYVTHTVALGGAFSGTYENNRYELRPELAFGYGKTWIGVVDFTGRAYGQVDTTITSDIGNESVVNLTARPEVVIALDAGTVAGSHAQLSFAPRLFCERQIAKTSISSCGDGVEIGIRSQSEDGLSSANFRIISDNVFGGNRSSYTLNLEHKF